MGLTIQTDNKPVTVIRKDGVSKAGNNYTMYSLMYSYKQGEEWKNVFLDAQFRKGTDLANKTKINITNAFMTGSEFNGQTKPKVFVLDYEMVSGGNAPSVEDFVSIQEGLEDELPFK